MDSLTHIALGAAIAEVTIGKKIGNKALLIGAVVGNIPDFDSIISAFLNPADALLFHRGISHSFFLLILLAPIVSYFLSKIDKDTRMRYADWLWLIALPWLSHILVDIFNTYGTGVFEPFSSVRLSYDSVAIVDVFLLAVMIPAIVIVWLMNKKNAKRRVFAWISITFLIFYFGLSVVIKENLESTIKKELAVNGVEYTRIRTAPLPLTNLIWMVVVEDSSSFKVEQRNILNINKPLLKTDLIKNHQLLDSADYYEGDMIKEFTKGFYTVEQTSNGFTIYDIRYSSLAMEYPKAYVFTFNLKKEGDAVQLGRSHPKRSLTFENIKLYLCRVLE